MLTKIHRQRQRLGLEWAFELLSFPQWHISATKPHLILPKQVNQPGTKYLNRWVYGDHAISNTTEDKESLPRKPGIQRDTQNVSKDSRQLLSDLYTHTPRHVYAYIHTCASRTHKNDKIFKFSVRTGTVHHCNFCYFGRDRGRVSFGPLWATQWGDLVEREREKKMTVKNGRYQREMITRDWGGGSL